MQRQQQQQHHPLTNAGTKYIAAATSPVGKPVNAVPAKPPAPVVKKTVQAQEEYKLEMPMKEFNKPTCTIAQVTIRSC
jgi:hypothetical protein